MQDIQSLKEALRAKEMELRASLKGIELNRDGHNPKPNRRQSHLNDGVSVVPEINSP